MHFQQMSPFYQYLQKTVRSFSKTAAFGHSLHMIVCARTRQVIYSPTEPVTPIGTETGAQKICAVTLPWNVLKVANLPKTSKECPDNVHKMFAKRLRHSHSGRRAVTTLKKTSRLLSCLANVHDAYVTGKERTERRWPLHIAYHRDLHTALWTFLDSSRVWQTHSWIIVHADFMFWTKCFCVVLCVSFCTGHFVMVPLNLTYLHCLQHSLFEHLFNLYC